MKYQDNMMQVADLQPDYLGFIFYDGSIRFFEGEMPQFSKKVKKIGVFVNASLTFIIDKIIKYDLQAVQLHGEESPEFCKELGMFCHAEQSEESFEIIKVFSIKDDFNFEKLKPYEEICDYYLFDTKGKLPGGNGYTFNWKVLKNYPSTKPYFLSGGIGLNEIEEVISFLRKPESKNCHAIDVNSRFEFEAGMKNIKKLKEFKRQLRQFE